MHALLLTLELLTLLHCQQCCTDCWPHHLLHAYAGASCQHPTTPTKKAQKLWQQKGRSQIPFWSVEGQCLCLGRFGVLCFCSWGWSVVCLFCAFFCVFFCVFFAFVVHFLGKTQKNRKKKRKKNAKNRKNIEKKSHKKVQSRPSPHPVQVPLLALVTSQ